MASRRRSSRWLSRSIAAGACAIFLLANAPALPLVQGGSITAADAERMSAACKALAVASGWTMQIAILNEHGDLVRFEKMDGAKRATGVLALEKARTAFKTGRSTREMGAMDPSGQRFFDAITIPGGLVMIASDRQVAFVGVSGSKPDNDEACAAAAIAAPR